VDVNCALGPHGCQGELEWHHVVKQQWIRKAFRYGAVVMPAVRPGGAAFAACRRGQEPDLSLEAILADERNLVWLCKGHHERITQASRNERARLDARMPEQVWEFAWQFGFAGLLLNDIDKRKRRT
jgi:hypothetical protein